MPSAIPIRLWCFLLSWRRSVKRTPAWAVSADAPILIRKHLPLELLENFVLSIPDLVVEPDNLVHPAPLGVVHLHTTPDHGERAELDRETSLRPLRLGQPPTPDQEIYLAGMGPLVKRVAADV